MVPWTYEIDGSDLVVKNIAATCFGGACDLGDDGQTESRWMNNGDGSDQSSSLQCALPIRSTESATKDSPLAFKGKHIPWFTTVMVWSGNDESKAIKCTLTDNGPDVSRFPTHAIDLNPPAASKFTTLSMKDIANKWSGEGFSYRIIDGARWIS